jgi:uncharacterized RDD family membrane protein YckC
MGAWASPQNQVPAVALPAGIQVASMGRRVGAWILDRFLAGLLAIVPVVMAIASGAVTLNQQALDQLGQLAPHSYQPFAHVTAPLLNVKTGPLVVAAVVLIGLSAVYYAGCWAWFGATPCQRALNLRVADVESGKNLPIGVALMRWFLLEGLSECLTAVFLVMLLNAIARTPTNEWLGTGNANVYGSFGGVGALANLVSGASSLWLIALIVSAGANPARRGIHDRLMGSIVVEPVRAVAAWPGYPPQAWPGYPPQAWPGYPPQAWPGYPPQGPAPVPPAADGQPADKPPEVDPGR